MKITTRLLDAALALGQMKAQSAVLPLIDLLRDSPLETVRFVAATALGEIKDQRVVVPLISALEDNEATPAVKVAAATALGNIKDNRAVRVVPGYVG